MTWVILGHNFLFGSQVLHVKNKEFTDGIQSEHTGGLAFEAVLQGPFSVDTFFFIGATLVSYLLLKDLDKTNVSIKRFFNKHIRVYFKLQHLQGWTNKTGVIHMLLFYVNRILRITIPYALVIAFFIGIAPLIITEPIAAAKFAHIEVRNRIIEQKI